MDFYSFKNQCARMVVIDFAHHRNKSLKTFSIDWPSTWNYISTNEEIKIGTNILRGIRKI